MAYIIITSLDYADFVGAQTFSPEANSESIREQAENSPTLAPAGQPPWTDGCI